MQIKKIGSTDSNIADNHTTVNNTYYNRIPLEMYFELHNEIKSLKLDILQQKKVIETTLLKISKFKKDKPEYHEKLDLIIELLQKE